MNMELSMQDFCEKVKTALQNELEENRVVRISEVPKNNGIVLHGGEYHSDHLSGGIPETI